MVIKFSTKPLFVFGRRAVLSCAVRRSLLKNTPSQWLEDTGCKCHTQEQSHLSPPGQDHHSLSVATISRTLTNVNMPSLSGQKKDTHEAKENARYNRKFEWGSWKTGFAVKTSLWFWAISGQRQRSEDYSSLHEVHLYDWPVCVLSVLRNPLF